MRVSALADQNPKTMQNRINIKSLLIGATMGSVIMLVIAAATTDSPHYGRFQLAMTDNYIFKIDTMTGQVWKSLTSNPSSAIMSANVGANVDK
jgi:hypothetical protein